MVLDSIKHKIEENKTLFYMTLAVIISFLIYMSCNYWFYVPKFMESYSKALMIIIIALFIKQIFERFILGNMTNNATYFLVAGVLFTLVSFYTSYELFRPFIGLSTILFTVILGIPIIFQLSKKEADYVKSSDISFWKRHRSFINFYVYFFIGVFLVLFMLSMIAQTGIDDSIADKTGIDFDIPDNAVFSFDDLIPEKAQLQQSRIEMPKIQMPAVQKPEMSEVNSIFNNNFRVMFIALILSLFFGAGALFLITFNASIFASALVDVILMKVPKKGILYLYSFLACNMGTMFIHMIPEVLAYFIAAIAGSLLSTAFINDRFMSDSFKKTVKESGLLIALAIAVLYISAFVEVFVSKQLNLRNVCMEPLNIVNIVLIAVILCIFVFDFFRRRRTKVVIDADSEAVEHTV